MSVSLGPSLGLTSLLIIGLVELVVGQETVRSRITRVCLLGMFSVGTRLVSLVDLVS